MQGAREPFRAVTPKPAGVVAINQSKRLPSFSDVEEEDMGENSVSSPGRKSHKEKYQESGPEEQGNAL